MYPATRRTGRQQD